MLRATRLTGVVALVLALACDSPEENQTLAPDRSAPVVQAAIVDGASSDNSFFRFMPPMVAGQPASPAARNDIGLYPTVEICELAGNACAAVVQRFMRPGKGSSRDKLDVGAVWSAKWRTSESRLNAQKNYRVRVRLDNYELGYADIDVVENAAQLAGVDQSNFIGVVKGSDVKLAFWIQSGIFNWIRNSGAFVVADDAHFVLVVPKRAVEDVHIGVLSGRTPPAGASLVSGSYYELVPAELKFSKPAQLVIKYNAGALPEGVVESSLKLLQYRDGEWSEVAGAITDFKRDIVTASITQAGNYAVGVLPTAAPVVNVTVETSAPVLGSLITGVQRVSVGGARSSCINNLRDESLMLANQYWRGPHSISIANGECPFQGHITRVGTYQFEAIVDGVAGHSAPFTVAAPDGATMSFSGIPAGPLYTGSIIATDNISVTVTDGAGNPLSNTDVEVRLTHAGFNFGGAAIDNYAQTTDDAGRILLPPGTWTLREVPGVNVIRAHLPNTSVAASHEITTNSGAPSRLFANPVNSTIAYSTPLNVTVFVQDANGIAVGLDGIEVSATLNNGTTSEPLGTAHTAHGEASFTFNFAAAGPNHTVTFAAAGLTAHTTNDFTIMGPAPADPGEVRLTGVTNNSISVEVQNVVFAGGNPLFQIRYRASPDGAYAMMDVPAASGAFIPVTLDGLSEGTQFEISARACDTNGCSQWTSDLSVPTLQPAPQNLRTTGLGTTFTMIAWDTPTIVNGAPHSFEVWLRQGSGALQLFSTTTTPAANLTGLTANTQYTAEVRACNASGCSSSQLGFTTLPLPTPPAAPNRLQLNSQSPTAVVIAWTDVSTNEAGFYVTKRTLPQTTLVRVATLAPGTNTYTDTDVIQGQTVVYQVQAFNEGGTTLSNIISTIVPVGQTQAMAPFNTVLAQEGTAGQPAMWPLTVRIINPTNNAPQFGVPVTFAITGGSGTFGGVTSVVVNTNGSGIATSPSWLLGSGSNTATATAAGFGVIEFTAQGN